MTYPLHLKRTHLKARPFEKEALDQIWKHPDVGDFYPPQAKNKYNLQAMVLQSDGRPVTESTVSVIFLLTNVESEYLEIAVRPKPGVDVIYAGWIFIPNGIAALDARVEDMSLNGFHVISTAGETGRILYGFDGSRYQQLSFAMKAARPPRLRKAS